MLVSDKLLVPDVTPHVARDDAIRHREPLDRLFQFHSSETQQSFASGGGGEGEIFRIKVCWSRLTSRRGPLIRTERCIALDQLDASDWNAQLLGDQLGLSRKNPLTEIAFPCVCGDDPIGVDGQPRIELFRIDVRGMRVERSLPRCGHQTQRASAKTAKKGP